MGTTHVLRQRGAAARAQPGKRLARAEFETPGEGPERADAPVEAPRQTSAPMDPVRARPLGRDGVKQPLCSELRTARGGGAGERA